MVNMHIVCSQFKCSFRDCAGFVSMTSVSYDPSCVSWPLCVVTKATLFQYSPVSVLSGFSGLSAAAEPLFSLTQSLYLLIAHYPFIHWLAVGLVCTVYRILLQSPFSVFLILCLMVTQIRKAPHAFTAPLFSKVNFTTRILLCELFTKTTKPVQVQHHNFFLFFFFLPNTYNNLTMYLEQQS